MNTTHPTHAARPPLATAAVAAPAESAVSWAAIFAGAVAAAALSLILLILGMGLGLSSVSPWSFEGVSRETFGWSTIIWISFTSIAASGLGGYLAGRLRTRWLDAQVDEVYFRDTAHGLLSWAVATLLTAAALTSAITGILGTGAKAIGAAGGSAAAVAGSAINAGGASQSEDSENDLRYWVDSMFRRAPSAAPIPAEAASADDMTAAADASAPSQQRARAQATREDVRPEIVRIIGNALSADSLDPDDRRYVAQRVAEQTGLSQAEAEARVSDIETRMRAAFEQAETAAREAADTARKASAYASLWLFITLLMGAFFASLFATFGGRQRDL